MVTFQAMNMINRNMTTGFARCGDAAACLLCRFLLLLTLIVIWLHWQGYLGYANEQEVHA